MTRTQHTYIDIRFANSKRITRWLGWNILFLCVCVVSISIHINLAVYIARPLFPISYMNEYFGMEALFKKNTRYIYIYIIHIRSQKRFLKTKLEIAHVPYVPCAPPHPDTHIYILFIMVFVALVCVVDGVVLDDFVCVCACVVDGSTFDLLHVLAKTTTFRIAHAAYSVRVKERNESKKKKHAKISLSWNKCVLAGLCCLSA